MIAVRLSPPELPKSTPCKAPIALTKVGVNRHTIMLARPLSELIEHVRHKKLPSFALVARTIKALVLGIFRWHLCDYIFLPDEYKLGVCHSIGGVKCIESESDHEKKYPYMIKNAIFLRFNTSTDPHSNDLPSHCRGRTRAGRAYPDVVEGVDTKEIKEVSVKSIVDWYQNVCNIEIIPRTRAMTIANLFSSPILCRVRNFYQH